MYPCKPIRYDAILISQSSRGLKWSILLHMRVVCHNMGNDWIWPWVISTPKAGQGLVEIYSIVGKGYAGLMLLFRIFWLYTVLVKSFAYFVLWLFCDPCCGQLWVWHMFCGSCVKIWPWRGHLTLTLGHKGSQWICDAFLLGLSVFHSTHPSGSHME